LFNRPAVCSSIRESGPVATKKINPQHHYYMKKILLFISGLLITDGALHAQTPSDGIMMKKMEVCFAVIYDHGTWDHYWEGSMLRINENIGTLTRNTTLPMVAAGITDKLNFIAGVPYVQTHSTGGQLAGVEGFQDLNIALKYQFLNRPMGKGKLMAFGTGGFATPVTNYLSDYMPYSLGFGTNEWSVRGIVQFESDKGMYVRSSLAHLWRGQTEVERDYYYNNGSYYTRFMDVPNAWNYQAAIGTWLLKYSLRVEVNYNLLKCTSGDDIRAYNMPQPTNKIEFDQVGFFAQYYFQKSVKGLGVLAYGSQMNNGRNMGKTTTIGGGVTYQFKVKQQKN
jgi:hypothetical protein